MNEQLVGACGIYCGACDHYLAGRENGKYLLKRDTDIGRRVADNPCGGCKNIEKLCQWCKECEIRNCASEKSLSHCGMCDQFPCDYFEEFKNGLLHKQVGYKNIQELTRVGVAEWLEKQEIRWSCPNCGSSFSFYEIQCSSCEKKIDGLYPDER